VMPATIATLPGRRAPRAMPRPTERIAAPARSRCDACALSPASGDAESDAGEIIGAEVSEGDRERSERARETMRAVHADLRSISRRARRLGGVNRRRRAGRPDGSAD
jgi:hypothetical protein